jgi:SAM-dependent methyltransferase
MAETILDQVRSKYAAAADTLRADTPGLRAVAEAFGYSAAELALLPADANLGLSCGNPTAFANLRPGEVVVDLGCGAGIDVLLAARKVGPSGKAIGIDMTDEMLARARRNAATPVDGVVQTNVEFHLATIDKLPLPDASVDCLISNCVINLAPDKAAVFREMNRVLKPGGRIAVSDIALKKPLPEALAKSVAAYIGCVAGAIPISDYEQGLRAAGFTTVEVIDTKKDLNAYALVEGQSGCCSPAPAPEPLGGRLNIVAEPACCPPARPTDIHGELGELLRQHDVNEYAASVQVYALKGTTE